MSTQPTERPPEWAMAEARAYLRKNLGSRRGLDYRDVVQDDEIETEIETDLAELFAAIIAKHAPRETANARLVRAAGNALSILEGIHPSLLMARSNREITELRAALAATEAQPEIGEVLDVLAHCHYAISTFYSTEKSKSYYRPQYMRDAEAAALRVLQKFGRGK